MYVSVTVNLLQISSSDIVCTVLIRKHPLKIVFRIINLDLFREVNTDMRERIRMTKKDYTFISLLSLNFLLYWWIVIYDLKREHLVAHITLSIIHTKCNYVIRYIRSYTNRRIVSPLSYDKAGTRVLPHIPQGHILRITNAHHFSPWGGGVSLTFEKLDTQRIKLGAVVRNARNLQMRLCAAICWGSLCLRYRSPRG